LAVTDPYKLSKTTSPRVSSAGVGISSARPQDDFLGKSLGFVEKILDQLKQGNEKEWATNANLAGTEFNNDLSNEIYRIQNDPSEKQKQNLPSYWKSFVEKKTLHYLKKYGGDIQLRDRYSKMLAVSIKSKITAYNRPVQLLWNQLASEFNKEQNGKLFQGISNDTLKNPENTERNIYKKLSVINGKIIGNPNQAYTSRWDRLTFLQSQKDLSDVKIKESGDLGGLTIFAKQKFFEKELRNRQKIQNYLVQQKQEEEAVFGEIGAFVSGSFYSGHESLANEIKNLNESKIQEFYSEENPSASMQELLEDGAEWKIRAEKEAANIKNKAGKLMEKFGGYFNASQRQKVLDNIDKTKEKFLKQEEEKIKNYIKFYKANRRATYEQMLNAYQSGRVFDSGDDYKDKVEAANDIISNQNTMITNASKLVLDKDSAGEPIGLGFDGETYDNNRLKRVDMTEKFHQVGVGKIIYDPITEKAGLTENTYAKLEKVGISRSVVDEVINTPYFNQMELKRFLENRPEDQETNKKIANAFEIVQKKDGYAVYYRNFGQALLSNKKHKHLYGIYLKNKMSFGRATLNVKQEQNFQSLVSGAVSDPTNMDLLPYRARKALGLGKINFNQYQQIVNFASNNAFPGLSQEAKKIVQPGIKVIDKIIKAQAGKALMPLEEWLDQLSVPQIKLRRKIYDYILMMSRYYQSKEEILIKQGTTVREKVDELVNRLQDETIKGTVNLKHGGRDNYYKVPMLRFKNLGAKGENQSEDLSIEPMEILLKKWNKAKASGNSSEIINISNELKKRQVNRKQEVK